MEEHLSKSEFLAHIGPIREDIKALVALQREQNGRVSKTETRIAVLEERTPPPSRAETNTVSGIVSAVVSAAMNGVSLWIGSQK